MAAQLPAPAEDGPEAVVTAFYSAYAAGNLKKAAEHMEAAPATTLLTRASRFFHARCVRVDRVIVRDVVVNGDTATVDADAWTTLGTDMPGGRTRREQQLSRFELVRTDRWRIKRWSFRDTAFVQRAIALPSAAERKAALMNALELHGVRFVEELSRQATNFSNALKYAEAREVVDIALAIARELGESKLIADLRGVEATIYFTQGDAARALEAGEDAVRIAEIGGDPDSLGMALLRLGKAQFSIRNAVSRAPYERILTLADFFTSPNVVSQAAAQLAHAGAEANDRREQLHYGLIALRYALIFNDNVSLYNSHEAIGEAYLLLGYNHLALRHYEQLRAVSERAGWKDGISLSYSKAALIHWKAKREKETLEAIEKGLPDADQRTKAFLLVLRGRVALHRLDLAAAERDIEEGLRTFDPQDAGRTSSMHNLVELRLRQGRHDDAVELAKTMVRDASKLSPREQLEALYTEVKALRKARRFDEARERVAELFRTVEALQATAALDETHWSSFYADRAVYDNEPVALAVDRGDAVEAFRAANATKARALRALIEQRELRISRLMNHQERARATALNERIVELNKQLVGANISDEVSARLQSELAGARLDLEELRAGVAARSQSLPAPAAIDDPLALASAHSVVQYVSTDEGIIVIGISPGKGADRRITATRIAITPYELSKKIDALLQLMESRDLAHAPAAREMFDLLLGPVRPLITSGEMLCVIPDEDLWRVPFQALLAPDDRYVAEMTTLFYAPSIALADLSRTRSMRPRQKDEPALLAFGNPQLHSRSVAQYRNAFAGEDVGELPDAEKEVREVARMYGLARSRVYIGEKATESALKSQVGRVGVIHIATHGAVDAASPLASAMLLAPGEASEDGLLEAREVLDLRVDSDLAVLSACSTGAGRAQKAEGVIGLSWAFLARGCPTTVVSQWKAASGVTSRLMIDFHRRLRAGDSAAAALQKTQKKMLADPRYRHPYYWAPFVVVGAQ